MSRRTSCILTALATTAALVWCTDKPDTKNYVLGPDDQISVHVLNVDEIGPQPIRIDMEGNINVALAGRIHVGGLTVELLENEIAKRLKSYLLSPTVSITITEYHSQPISILGAVSKPGVYQLQGHKSLFEALSLAEGLRTDAGDQIRITRRKEWGSIPLESAVTEASGEYSVASVSIKSVMEATDPRENIEMKPGDVISVPKAKMVYVVGSVRKPGGFVLSEKETLSVLQAVSLAEGLDRAAAPRKAVILRSATGNGGGTKVSIDVSSILSGKSNDLPLEANDILFIPNSAAKSIGFRSTEALIQAATGVVIYK